MEIKGTTQPDKATLTKCRLLAIHTQQPVILYAGNIGNQLIWEWDADGKLLVDGKESRGLKIEIFSTSAPEGGWTKAYQKARSARWEYGESPEQSPPSIKIPPELQHHLKDHYPRAELYLRFYHAMADANLPRHHVSDQAAKQKSIDEA